MNEVFIIGKIISRVEFNFIYKGIHISKAKSEIVLNNKSKIQIIGYNNIADYMYQHIKEHNIIFINGEISKNKIILKRIQKL